MQKINLRMGRSFINYSLLIIVFASCNIFKKPAANKDDKKINLTLLQVNDVYEIAPIESGAVGGMARVATIKNEELKKNKNTWLLMAGDFLSPSVYNSLKYEDKRIRGRQMVEAMNSAGVDMAIFGNHEFDITEQELRERLNESAFQWVSSNTFYKKNDSIRPFSIGNKGTIPESRIVNITDEDGTSARIGIIGITIPSNPAAYVYYSDPLETAKKISTRIKDSCDAVVMITHQEIKDDIQLAKDLPYLPVIIGGHEHDMRFEKIGNVFITKAHANARSVYIIHLAIDKKRKKITVKPELKMLDSSVAIDSKVDSVVRKWMGIANANYQSIGFDPGKIVMAAGDSLEGRDSRTRRESTNLTDLVLRSMSFACPQADIVIFNGGSIRLDDVLFPPVSQYDILRALPFGGSIREVDMKGSMLRQILEAGQKNKGTGGFLHYSPALYVIDPDKVYRVATSDFLLSGAETNLGFLNKDNPSIVRIYPEETAAADPRSDIRLAIVQYLTK